MAFPVIATTATTLDANGAATAVTMPAGIVAGDLLLVFVAHGKDEISAPIDGGWEPLIEQVAAGGVKLSVSVYGKIAVGGDTCSLVAAGGDETVVHALRITGHGVGDIDLALVRATAAGLSPSPNPPLCNPNGELKDRLWIEAFAAENGSDFATYQSTNFTQVAQAETPGSKALLAVARRSVNATSLNPGVMAMSAAENWIAVTLAVPPTVELAGVIRGAATFAGTLTSNPLAAVIQGTATFPPCDLTVAVRFAAALTGTLSLTGALSTEIPINSSISGLATTTASLTTAILAAAILEGTVSVGADLTAYLPLFADPITGALFLTAFLAVVIVPGISRETLSLTGIENETFTVTN